MKNNYKNTFLFMIYSICLGAIIGLIVWCFLKVINISIEFIWEILPGMIQIPFYTITICVLGGLLIGIFRHKTGDYPEDLETVISKVKKDGRYSYNNIGSISVSAILPLIFGASVGPEAGLSGIIVGLCTWLTDKFNYLFKEMKELTQIGVSATLGTIFNSPMFGFVEPIESEEGEEHLPKRSKIVLYFLAIFGAFGTVILLNNSFGGSVGIANFIGLEIGKKEYILLIPLSIVGVLAGYLYYGFNKIINKIVTPINNHTIIQCTLSGLILGVIGTFLPYTMFSGEHQMEQVINDYQIIGVTILLLTAILKLLVTNTCIIMGLKGGHFFPCIFSGVCIGYSLGILVDINYIFCACVVTTALMSCLMKKPFATVLLLMICFPVSAIPVMLFSAVLGSAIKTPNFLQNKIKE